MSQQGKREVVERLRHRYLQASRSEKTKILDEFVALSGLHRKSAIRALRHGYQRGAERRAASGCIRSLSSRNWRRYGASARCTCSANIAS